MTEYQDPAQAALRRSIYFILIALSLGHVAGRILAVNSVDFERLERYLHSQGREDKFLQRPFLSANDRSRWATVRALVEHGTYEIDEIVSQPNWDTIDMVQHFNADGELRLYSSKPTLYPTLLAGVYWVIHRATGATLGTHPYEIGRGLLLGVHLTLLAIYFWCLARLVERLGRSDWSRIYVFAAGAFATFLTTFAIVINNHLVAAASVAVTLEMLALAIWDERRGWWIPALGGLASAFAAANELPALSFFALSAVAFCWHQPSRFFLAFLPASLLVVAGFFGTNYSAHDTWRPPYAHREDGPLVTTLEDAKVVEKLDAGEVPDAVREKLTERGNTLSENTNVDIVQPGERWHLLDMDAAKKFTLVHEGGRLAVHEFDNWYDYTYQRGTRTIESYWRTRERRSKIDQGEDDAGTYALHSLIGHHGVFSLTPMWLLFPVGLLLWLFSGSRRLMWFSLGIAAMTIVCIAFYLRQPVDSRNYGGMTSGFRWLFWFAPLWLLALLPICDRLAKNRIGRGFALLLLLASAWSVSFPTWNPWTHPWLTKFLIYLEVIEM